MVIFKAEITENLPVFDVLSRLFQGFIYRNIAPYEHDGFKHSSGKVFKSSAFRIEYPKDSSTIKILFTSLLPETEEKFVKYINSYGMELGNIRLHNQELDVRRRAWRSNEIIFWGDILLTVKDENGQKRFLEPKEERFLENLKRQSFQKFETLLRKEYWGDWEIEVLKQSEHKTKLYYNKKPYFTWSAKYRLKADNEMINLLLNTGVGSQTMKGFGVVRVERDNFFKEDVK
jgi:CRISPR-associated endoribonuclease Cas6